MRFWPSPIACDISFPRAIEAAIAIFVRSETEVRPRIAVSTVSSKFGESIAFAMFSEPRLQAISLPTCLKVRSSLYSEGVETCRISEHRFDIVIRPLIGFARFTVSSNMM